MSFFVDNSAILLLAVPTIILFVWTVLQQISLRRIKKNQKNLFAGKKGKDLEKIILDCRSQIANANTDIKDLFEITNKIHTLSLKSLHKVGMIRFNPFRDIGGDQSFSVALLDGDDTGAVISSIYSREGVRIYAKSVQKGQCEKYQLTEEEKHAIKIASSTKDNQGSKRKV